jgi:hypothetical protein
MAYISFQPSDYFNTKLYTGTGSSNTVTGVGFQPDLTWIKNRGDAESHCLFDAVRTNGYYLKSDATSAEIDGASAGLWSAFASDGFTVLNGNRTNDSSDTYCSWNWKANGAGSSNTDGSITSTVSASTTSGFSIVTWTGNSGSVGHGLGKKPAMIITKSLGASGGWYTTHKSLGAEMQDNYIFLNTGDANSTNNDIWGGEPTTSTFSVGSGLIGNTTQVAYCFTPIKGFSAMGSYTGNANADGTFVYTGMSPAFVLVKNTASTDSWVMFDNKRPNPYNVIGSILQPNTNIAETVNSAFNIDFVSTGFKIRGTDGAVNGSGNTIIFMAFAAAPLVSSNGLPAVAR